VVYHAGVGAEAAGADARADRRIRDQVLHPPGPSPVLGDQVVAALVAGEPDLDPSRAAAAPPMVVR